MKRPLTPKETREKLEALGLGEAWKIFKEAEDDAEVVGETAPFDPTPQPEEERAIVDIVGKLMVYGTVTEGQEKYLHGLLERIERRKQWKAEKDAAEDCPEGKTMISGTVLTVKLKDTTYGPALKMLVKDRRGFLVWGTVPKNLEGSIAKGAVVVFEAEVTRSENDPKFGFFRRAKVGE